MTSYSSPSPRGRAWAAMPAGDRHRDRRCLAVPAIIVASTDPRRPPKELASAGGKRRPAVAIRNRSRSVRVRPQWPRPLILQHKKMHQRDHRTGSTQTPRRESLHALPKRRRLRPRTFFRALGEGVILRAPKKASKLTILPRHHMANERARPSCSPQRDRRKITGLTR